MPEVIVIGGANVDIKGRASEKILGHTSNPGEVTISAGGVARNIAENLARLEVPVALMTVLGDDDNGRLLRQTTAAAGVDMSMTLVGPAMTGSYLVILDNRGELQTALNDMRAIESLKVAQLERMLDRLKSAAMLVADCNIDVACLEWLCHFSGVHGVRLLIEPVSVPKAKKLLRFKRERPVYAITPNELQLETLTGEKDVAAGLRKLHELGFENIVLHRGSEGALVSSGEGQFDVPPVTAETIADVTGAGDAAVAGLILGLLEGLPLKEAAGLGQKVAALKLSSHLSVSPKLSRDSLLGQ